MNGDLLGSLAELPQYVREHRIGAIFIALPLRLAKRTENVVRELRDTTASLYYIPDVFVFDLIQARTDSLDGLPIVTLAETPFHGWRGVLKRSSDILLASLMLLLALPVMCLIALAIKLTSRGTIIFKQQRYGLDGEEITVYKFRTMTVSENGERVVQVSRNDPRVTRVGRFLRRYSLDELPQLINVLQGRMSVVDRDRMRSRTTSSIARSSAATCCATRLRPESLAWRKSMVAAGKPADSRTWRSGYTTIWSTCAIGLWFWTSAFWCARSRPC